MEFVFRKTTQSVQFKSAKSKFRFKLFLATTLLGCGLFGLFKLNIHNSTQAATLPSIFDKSGDDRYFGKGSRTPSHNVLPPIFAFYEGKALPKVPYAIDPQRLGLGEIDHSTSDQKMESSGKVRYYNDPENTIECVFRIFLGVTYVL